MKEKCPAMLSAAGVCIDFGGVRALDGVSISVEPGSIIGLVGPNGAGKSTLFNCMTGLLHPDAGKVTLDDREITNWSPERRARAGIGRSFQTPRIDPKATVLESVLTGFASRAHQTTLGAFIGSPAVRRQERVFEARARELIQFLGLGDGRREAGELPAAHLRLLEVARTLAGDARFLLLDEPAAGMDDRDRGLLGSVVHRVASDGLGVLLVEHNFRFVISLCDRILVLANGRTIAEGAPDEIRGSDEIARVYLGQAKLWGASRRPPSTSLSRDWLQVTGL